MKLICKIEVVNRAHNNLNIRSNGKYIKSTLALSKEPKNRTEYFGVTALDNAPTKLTILTRNDIPSKGFPRTLESLYMAGLKLCNFRRDILLLRRLTVLDLSNNEIEKIPFEFARMPNLSELYLTNNSLGSLESVDWRWLLGPQITKTLKLLDLCGNKLKVLPRNIWKLHNLVTLKLDNNLLERLPASLGRMRKLSGISVLVAY
ncbi:unnamed protein product [Pieris brassicae]|uniref:PIF1/LRR1 pleckstrin homology domain-containing protein n=1 Tax=Pieris brassicae TaxID=7116 RepID=A0A9P0X9G7_PIEBR|nr:unnamed protein product [Pieris brassicae]